LLLLHPAFDRDPHGVGHGQDLVRPEPDHSIGADAAQLAVDLLDRDPLPECQADQAAERFDVGHQRATRLA
jgi:hypothetical protein